MDSTQAKKPFFSKRMFLTLITMACATAALWGHRLEAGNYVLLMLGCIAGHHAPEYIKAWRGSTT